MTDVVKKKTTPRKAAAKKTAPVEAPTDRTVTRYEIEQLAYHMWLESGQKHGDDAQHWLQAEQHLGPNTAEA